MRTGCLAAVLLLVTMFGYAADDSCNFDADDADSPRFAEKMTKCNSKIELFGNDGTEQANVPTSGTPVRLYGNGSVDPQSGISELPVVAPGTLNHNSGKLYEAREAYSLRPGAKFEDSVTLAIQKLHLQMAHYCARGWTLAQEKTTPDPRREGDFYLHYQFRCADNE